MIKRQFAAEIRSTGARLGGQLVAAGSATSYRIEYGTDTSYGTTTDTVHLGIERDALHLERPYRRA